MQDKIILLEKDYRDKSLEYATKLRSSRTELMAIDNIIADIRSQEDEREKELEERELQVSIKNNLLTTDRLELEREKEQFYKTRDMLPD